MHNFQTYPIDMLEFNPFTKIGKEWALVTTNADTKDNTMTISWGGMGVMWGKNVVYVFIRDTRYTKEFIDKNEFFSISFLDETYRQALNYCGAHSGRDEDKIANALCKFFIYPTYLFTKNLITVTMVLTFSV